MAAPAAYPVTIKVNDVDVTAYVPFESMSLDDRRSEVSTFECVIENPSGVTPAMYHTLVITEANDPSSVVFNGIITELKTRKRDNGITTEYDVSASDLKVRLQKSVLPYKLYEGTDLEILQDLLADAYPDLSSLFDFSGISATTSNLSLTTDNTSLLDALNTLADMTGATWNLDDIFNVGSEIVTWDTGGYSSYTASIHAPGVVENLNIGKASPNFSNSYGFDRPTSLGSISLNPVQYLGFQVILDLGGDKEVTNINYDAYCNNTVSGISLEISIFDCSGFEDPFLGTNSNADGTRLGYDSIPYNAGWRLNRTFNLNAIKDFTLPRTMSKIGFRYRTTILNSSNHYRYAADNLSATTTEGYGPLGTIDTSLNWDLTPDASAFNLDIGAGDEFASDITLTEGDYDFNSVIIIGGIEDVPVDWTYESDGDLTHINLELPIKDYTISVNTGTDGSPVWSAQTVGIWGTDEFTGTGGTADVLYDPDYHWLYFESAPPALSKSVRLQGTIPKPIRVVVDESGSDPTLAIVVHDASVSNEDEAYALAQSELRNRNQPNRLTFKTYEPGLKPGTQITVTDSARGLNQTTTIQRVITTWLGGSGHATFDVECGPNEAASADGLLATVDKQSRTPPSSGGGVTTTQLSSLTDNDDAALTDNDGKPLYEAS